MPNRVYLRVAMGVRILLWALVLFAVLFGEELMQSNAMPCMFVTRFGVECPSCGSTRAVVSLLHGDFASAAAYNPVVAFALVPILAVLLVSDLVVILVRKLTGRRMLSPFEYCFIVFGGKLVALSPVGKKEAAK